MIFIIEMEEISKEIQKKIKDHNKLLKDNIEKQKGTFLPLNH